MLPSCLVKIMLQTYKAKDIILDMRDAAVRICNLIESPSGFVFICAFVEHDVSPCCVEGWGRCFEISSFHIFLTRMTKIGYGVVPWLNRKRQRNICGHIL